MLSVPRRATEQPLDGTNVVLLSKIKSHISDALFTTFDSDLVQ